MAYKLKVTKLCAQSQTNANVHKKNGFKKNSQCRSFDHVVNQVDISLVNCILCWFKFFFSLDNRDATVYYASTEFKMLSEH